jgi:hypothetical protein
VPRPFEQIAGREWDAGGWGEDTLNDKTSKGRGISSLGGGGFNKDWRLLGCYAVWLL